MISPITISAIPSITVNYPSPPSRPEREIVPTKGAVAVAHGSPDPSTMSKPPPATSHAGTAFEVFIRNIVQVLAETRAGFAITRPKAFVYCNLIAP